MSVICRGSGRGKSPNKVVVPPKGITAAAIMAGTTLSAGASRKRARSTWLGIRSSLKNSLIPSAMGCSSPQGPTRVGPKRTWMRAITFRSTQVM